MSELAALFIVQHEDWMDQAACKGHGHSMFVLEQGYTGAKAAAVCKRCPVTGANGPCASYARRTGSVGIWGGLLFTFREAEPQEVYPIEKLQDARPVVIKLDGYGAQTPGILGIVSGFSRNAILG